MERRVREILEAYEPQTEFQKVVLAQHHLSEAPMTGRQREALRAATTLAGNLLPRAATPPSPRDGA